MRFIFVHIKFMVFFRSPWSQRPKR